MRGCVVPKCKTKFNLHRVPFTDKTRWKAWLTNCPFLLKYTLRQLENIKMCENHFLPEYIVNNRLTKSAIPTLNLGIVESSANTVLTPSTNSFIEVSCTQSNEYSFKIVHQIPSTSQTDKHIQIQTVSETQCTNNSIEPSSLCSPLNVNPQQFYVDVDNSSELTSVSDQFVIPEGENNMYSNSYLLQAVENEKEEQMEQDNVDHEKEIAETSESASVDENVNVENADGKNSDCTEITLSDELYQLLEKKGWILLEIGERIFLLDTLGLRDITEDEKLIEKLKNEADSNEDELVSSVKIKKMDGSYDHSESNYEKLEDEQGEEHVVNFVVQDDDIIEDDETSQDTTTYYENEEDVSRNQEILEDVNKNGHLTSAQSPHDYVRLKSVQDTSVTRDNNALRIKTCFSFKDIPPEIVLGRTIHGKKLVASVRTGKPNVANKNTKQSNSITTGSAQDSRPTQLGSAGLDETKFKNLIHEAVWGIAENCTMKDVTAAEIVVQQLLRVPAFRPTVMERRLLITKIVIQEYEQTGKMYAESIPTLVTGQVIKDDGKISFIHLPDMLRMSIGDEENNDQNQRNKDADEDHYLHIHIRELKAIDGITRISITLNKRRKYIGVYTFRYIKEISDGNNRQKLIFACSACAAVYKTEEGLRLHQETECMEIDDMLTIDAETANNAYTVVSSGKDKQYMCNQCHSLFTKLSNCQKHIKTHYQQDEEEECDISDNNVSKKERVKKGLGVFKCKMCPSAYFYAATLSKHIVSKHIKIKSK